MKFTGWVGDKHLEVRFTIHGEYRGATFSSPPELPDMEILSVKDTETGEEVDWKSQDYPFRRKIEDFAWMEWDMIRAEQNELFDEPLELHSWEEQ